MITLNKYDCILILFGYFDLGHCVKMMIIFTSLGEGIKNCLPFFLFISVHIYVYLCLSATLT